MLDTIITIVLDVLVIGVLIWSFMDVRRERRHVHVYGSVLREMIDADERCGTPGCQVTNLGHVLAACTPETVAVVKSHDPLFMPDVKS